MSGDAPDPIFDPLLASGGDAAEVTHDDSAHREARRALSAAVAAGRLPHALLITGEAGIGKEAFARWLVASRWCTAPEAGTGLATDDGRPCYACPACRKLATANHPDFLEVRRDPPPEADPEGWGSKHEITVDQVRKGVLPMLGLRAVEGRGRAVLICGADDLNEEAQNALLKTLEEPPGDSLLLLVSSREERLLDTIRSRCQEVRLFPEAGDGSTDPLLRGRPGLTALLQGIDSEAVLNALDLLLQGELLPAAFARQLEELTSTAPEDGPTVDELQRFGLELLHLRLRDLSVLGSGGSPEAIATAAPLDVGRFPAPEALRRAESAVLQASEDMRRHVATQVMWVALGREIARARVGGPSPAERYT